MSDKSFYDMTDAGLKAELTVWEKHVETAGGWSSAYFAAKQLKAICAAAAKRGLTFINKYPIKVG